MINLLPPDTKQAYRFGHYNVSLVRWVILFGIGFFVVGLIGSYGWLSLRNAVNSSEQQSAVIETNLQKAQLSQTNAQVTEISNSFKLVQKVLSQEILFSQLLRQMAAALPDGTYLSGLNITEVYNGSGLDVAVDAVSYEAATQVQLNLADPDNQIFAKADIQNITCDSTNAQNPDYPCKVTLRAQFADNNQFLFINQGKVTQ